MRRLASLSVLAALTLVSIGAVADSLYDAEYGVVEAGGGSGIDAPAAAVLGGACYSDADSLELTAAGTSGQVLTSAGAAAPTWTTFSDTFDASAELLAIMDDETGTGALCFADTPTLVTPVLGAATATSVTAPLFSSNAADPADAGIVRLGNAESVCWEASPTGTDVCWSVNASEEFAFTATLTSPGAGTGSERYGAGAVAAGTNGVAVGNSASASGDPSGTVAVGYTAAASGNGSTAVGSNATASSTGAVAMGRLASATTGTGAIAIGNSSSSTAAAAVCVGRSCTASAASASGYGENVNCTAAETVCIGQDADAGGAGSIAIGSGAETSTFTDCAAIGEDATCTANNQFLIGTSGQPMNFTTFGKVSMGTGSTITIDGATTFAVTSSYHVLACTGPETIDTITGGYAGMVLYLENSDTECTINDDDDATAANAIDLTGTATTDVGAVSKVITLLYNGTHWQQTAESDN